MKTHFKLWKAILAFLIRKPYVLVKKLVGSPFKLKLLCAIIAFGYFLYSRSRKSQVERIFKSNLLNTHIVDKLTPFIQSYQPTFYLPTAFLQILKGERAKDKYVVKYEAQTFVLPDEEEIVVEWYPPEYASMDSKTPIVAFILGICGTSCQSYCKILAHMVKEKGWRFVVLNRRGFAGQKLKRNKFMHKNEAEDIHFSLLKIREIFEEASIYLVGVSAGANWATRYLGIYKAGAPVNACTAISNPFNIGRISFCMSQDFQAHFFSKYIASGLKKILMSQLENPQFEEVLKSYYKDISLCKKEIHSLRTCWEFDEYLSTKFSGGLIRSGKRLRLLLPHLERALH